MFFGADAVDHFRGMYIGCEGKRAENGEFRPHARLIRVNVVPSHPAIYNLVSITWVYRKLYPGRRTRPSRARGTRERKGDDKSGRTRRIEKVAPAGPGNGIPGS